MALLKGQYTKGYNLFPVYNFGNTVALYSRKCGR